MRIRYCLLALTLIAMSFLLGWHGRGDYIFSGMFQNTVETLEKLPVK